MRGEVAALDLRLRRRSALACAAGVGLYALVIVALYPTFEGDTSLDAVTRANPKLAALFGAAGSLTTPDGWMNANLYTNFLPLFALLVTIGDGAAAIAGQDEQGTLGGIASLAITRRRLLGEKIVALAVLSLPVPVVALAATLAGRHFGLDLSLWPVVQTTTSVALMAVDLGLVALAVGCWTGSRGAAIGAGTSVAAAAYVISSLAPVVPWVGALRYLSPLYWSVGADQVRVGTSPTQAFLLVVTAAVLGVVSWAGLRRLDIR